MQKQIDSTFWAGFCGFAWYPAIPPASEHKSVLLRGLQVIKAQHFLSFQAGDFAIISLP